MKGKHKREWWAFPIFLLELFFLTFVLLYLSKFGFMNFLFVVDETLSWKWFFNLALFYMMVIFFLNGTLRHLYEWLGIKND